MRQPCETAARLAAGSVARVAALGLAVLFAAVCCLIAAPGDAWADQDERPCVLVLDSGLGDLDSCMRAWLGEDVQEVSSNGGMTLATAASPRWWPGDAGQPAPHTFVLGAQAAGTPLTVDQVAWALDNIGVGTGQQKTLVVAMGTPGLVLRAYMEDQGSVKQSSRADIVGAVFCGTPHNGYTTIGDYPELPMWETMAKAAGLTVADITAGSDYLAKLNGSRFPSVAKTLVVVGQVGDLGFGLTDGAGVQADYTLADSVASQLQFTDVAASAAQNINLKAQWEPFTNNLGNKARAVDSGLVERISAMQCYAISSDVRDKVRQFYDAWFAEGAPTTAIANALALDLSGSMTYDIEPGHVRIDAAKNATREYLTAVEAYAGMPYSAPIQVSSLGFNVQDVDICTGYDAAARQAISDVKVEPYGDTNIGAALEDALGKLTSAPLMADRRILLLSDGERTVGMTNEEMLAGPVARAKAEGVVIDTIGFGEVSDADAAFLEQVSRETGGITCKATDVYELEVNFLRSYYTSLGVSLVDEELPAGSAKEAWLGSVDEATAAVSIGVVGQGYVPQVTLKCDGQAVDPSRYTTQEENAFLAIQCVGLDPGEYTVSVSGGDGAAHVFSAKQKGMAPLLSSAAEQDNSALLLLALTGVLLVVAVGGVVGFTLSRSRKVRK